MKPRRWKLESLSFEDPLTISVQGHLLLPTLDLPLQTLNVGDEVHGLRGRSRLDRLLLHVATGFGNLEINLNQNKIYDLYYTIRTLKHG